MELSKIRDISSFVRYRISLSFFVLLFSMSSLASSMMFSHRCENGEDAYQYLKALRAICLNSDERPEKLSEHFDFLSPLRKEKERAVRKLPKLGGAEQEGLVSPKVRVNREEALDIALAGARYHFYTVFHCSQALKEFEADCPKQFAYKEKNGTAIRASQISIEKSRVKLNLYSGLAFQAENVKEENFKTSYNALKELYDSDRTWGDFAFDVLEAPLSEAVTIVYNMAPIDKIAMRGAEAVVGYGRYAGATVKERVLGAGLSGGELFLILGVGGVGNISKLFSTSSVAKTTTQVSKKLLPVKMTPALKGQLDEMFRLAPSAKKEIDTIADEVAEIVGGKVLKAPIKGRPRAEFKLLNNYQGEAIKLKDLARNTIAVPRGKVDEAVELLKSRHKVVGENVFKVEGSALGYQGTNLTVETSVGLRAEIQVNPYSTVFGSHVPENARKLMGDDTYAALSKYMGRYRGGLSHRFYEKSRVLPKGHDARLWWEKVGRQYHEHIRNAEAAVLTN